MYRCYYGVHPNVHAYNHASLCVYVCLDLSARMNTHVRACNHAHTPRHTEPSAYRSKCTHTGRRRARLPIRTGALMAL